MFVSGAKRIHAECIAGLRRLAIPIDRLDVIFRETAETTFVKGAENFHGAPVSGLGGLAVPLGSLGKIFGNADAILIGKGDKVLRVCIASVRTGKKLGVHALGGSLRPS